MMYYSKVCEEMGMDSIVVVTDWSITRRVDALLTLQNERNRYTSKVVGGTAGCCVQTRLISSIISGLYHWSCLLKVTRSRDDEGQEETEDKQPLETSQHCGQSTSCCVYRVLYNEWLTYGSSIYDCWMNIVKKSKYP